jgi:hypothetical protein
MDAIADAAIILTNGSKPSRVGGVEVLEGLKDRFVLCGSKFAERVIAPELPSAPFWPRVTR